jgi:type IV pilus assembly protein PilQ
MSKNVIVEVALVLGALAGSAAHATGVNRLSDLVVRSGNGGEGVEVRVACTRPPTFNVFRMKDPDRLVVDVTGADVGDLKGHHEGLGVISGIVASQFSDPKTKVARLLFALDGPRRFDVKVLDGQLVVSIEGGGDQEAATPSAPSGSTAIESPPVEVPPPQGVLASRVDEKPVRSPARRLKAVAVSASSLRLSTDGEIARFAVMELAFPPRLAIDLFDLSGTPKPLRSSVGLAREVRVGAHSGKVRVVVEFARRASFDVRRRPDGLAVSWSPAPAGSSEVASASPVQAEAVAEVDGRPVIDDASAPPAPVAEIENVKFLEASTGGVLELQVKGAPRWTVDRPDGKSAVLTFEDTRVPHAQEKSLDTSALDTPIKMISVFGVPGRGRRARVVVAGAQAFDQVVSQRGSALRWKFSAKEVEEATTVGAAAGFNVESTTVAEEGAPQQRRAYVGKRVSFEFKDIDVHNLLRIIAEISKKNIVVGDDVAGKITIRLRNVPWDQALELVLRSKGLGKEEFGNIVRVAPLGTLESEAKQRAERKKNERLSRDVAVALVPVNYATAGEMSTKVKDVLTERGTVTVDARTNTLIVRDLPENMGKVRSMVASLDLQTPQVLIEGRIVEASTRFAREIGIQWGGQAAMSPGTGNPTGLLFPNSVAVTGGIPTGNATGVSAPANYAVSLPVGAGDGSGGALGMVFGSVGGAAVLNLRLSALEANGSVKTISAPKVTTMDNAAANISQGVSIPFQSVSAAGANTAFIEARLSLQVTPHITQDGSVLMNIHAQNNQPDPANAGANGQPGIARKEATTTVLVKDGETTVIGGIYVRTGSSNQAGLPILSKIPVIGFFFRNYRESETKNELLIFITPRILNRTAVVQSQ